MQISKVLHHVSGGLQIRVRRARLVFASLAILTSGLTGLVQAQTWTQVSIPNVGTCYYPGGATTNGCVMGNSTEPSSQPNPMTVSNPGIINNPGLGTDGNTQGQYRTSCSYPNGTPQQYNGPNIWWGGGKAGTPVEGSSSYWLISNYVQWYDAFYGMEFNGRFLGSTSPANSGHAAAFYTDNYCFQGGREYGVRYDFNSGALQLYWSANTNCSSGDCYTNSSLTSPILENSIDYHII